MLGIFLLCTFLALVAVKGSKEFKVGDAEGWKQPAQNETQLYNHWASKLRFHTGDSLRFEYKNDSVVLVDKWGYYHCNSSRAISVFEDGNTLVNLDKEGWVYFISGEADHCKQGQRLLIEVMISLHPKRAINISPAPAPAPAPSPHSSSATSLSLPTLTSLLLLLTPTTCLSPHLYLNIFTF